MKGIFAVVDLKLKWPFKRSQETLVELVRIWQMRLVKCSSNAPEAIIEIPVNAFKKIFGAMPAEGNYPPPKGTGMFIAAITVREVKAE